MNPRCFSSIILCGLLAACSSKPEIQTVPNPMPGLWNKVKDDIQELETRQAQPSEWNHKAESAKDIANITGLLKLTRNLQLSATERSELQHHYKNSTRVVHYGFEGNFHALVFFSDQGIPKHVIRW